jgi:RNA polymerase sigma factor (sigma-70 family)
MVNSSGVNPVVRYVHTFFNAQAFAGLSDGQLLERFLARRDSAAREALVGRHGPMVLGVCQRVLRDYHDAEDAFQATFLVLARRAASIWPREKVVNRLYGVAYQTAMKARATRARRRMREGAASDTQDREAASRAPAHDLAELLDHELSRLPDKYRAPVVLCELEGKSHHEAAEQLGWPIGTVSGRLSRAKALLARRLTSRGVSLAGGSLAVLLAQSGGTASASVPALPPSTVKAASLFAVGRAATAGAVSSEVTALAGEVLKSMLLTRIKIMTAALLVLTLAGSGLWQASTWAGGKAQPDGRARAAVNGGVGKGLSNGCFRVTVTEVINKESRVVTQVDIETVPGSKVELLADRKKSSGTSITSTAPGPNGLCRVRMTLSADQVESKVRSRTEVHFKLAVKVGKLSTSTSETIPMPAGAKGLSDVLKVPIQSGEHKCGQATKLATMKGVTYTLVVTGPR